MFTRENASELRNSLPLMQFKGSGPAVAHSDNLLLQQYIKHYGLALSDSELAVSHTLGTVVSAPFQLVCQYFSLPAVKQKGSLFLLHGYYDHAGIYGHLIKQCLQQGFNVVIVDLPGHGLSSGKVGSIDCFGEYRKALLDCLFQARAQGVQEPWNLVGQSMGGAVIIDGLLNGDLPADYRFERFVVLGPLLWPRRWHRNKLLFLLTRYITNATRRNFSTNSHDSEFLQFLQYEDQLQCQYLSSSWIQAMIDYQNRFKHAPQSNQPLHIIQGTDDGTVDWQYNLPKFQQKFPQSKTYMIAGARHHLVNESPEYRNQVFATLENILSGKP
jgi:alpha-beta hydrolase superfamily lysophospholipase